MNSRPHSRPKTVGSGSVNVNRGKQVNTGGRPVGFGGRSGGSSGGSRSGGGLNLNLNFKTILIIIVLLVVAFFIFRKCGGDMPNVTPTYSPDVVSPADESNSSDSSPDLTVSPLARSKFYTPADGDSVTIMVYMCATDLESDYGMATKDINEMLYAEIGDNVNIILETGGCKKWQNSTMSNSCNQIYRISKGGLSCLEQNFGTASMTDPNELTKFINYCTSHYDAERRILIFWDHGGGSVTGYGYDEKHPNSSSMTLSKINTALKNANCTFDFIGFDACLMATLETALVCNNYADYLIASEETEPGTGWYYTNWLKKLTADTSMPTVRVAESIINDFIGSCCSGGSGDQITLSVTDLAELDGTLPSALLKFAESTNELVTSDDYKLVSDARSGARQFSPESKLNQVDLADFASRVGTSDAKALASVIKAAVKYNRTTMSRSYGLSIYFPYETTSSVKSAVASYSDMSKDEDYGESISAYSRCVQSFASLEYGGQIAAAATQTSSSGGDLLGSLISSFASGGSSTSPVDALLGSFLGGGSSSSSGFGIDASDILGLLSGFSGRSMPAEYDWVDTELIASKAMQIGQNFLDPSRITVSTKNGRSVLELTDEEWGFVSTVELNVFVKDGDGYIDLGLDNTFEFLDDEAMLVEYDGTWLTVNGNLCAYYLVSDVEEEDGTWTTTGRIPALLNGDFVNLQVVFNRHNPEGTIVGAYPLYDSDEIGVQAKGDIVIEPGDEIEFLCDYYDLDGNYSASYTLGSSMTVPRSGFTLTNLRLNRPASDLDATFRITDIYGNCFWLPINE